MTLNLRAPADLPMLATQNPGAVLGAMGYSCLGWRNLDDNSRRWHLGQILPTGAVNVSPGTVQFGEAGVGDRLPRAPLQQLGRAIGPTTNPRMRQVATSMAAQLDPWNRAIDQTVGILNRHCELATARSANIVPFVRPAGLASAYTTAASYTNGPTLLAAGAAFAAGYAIHHFLIKPSKATKKSSKRGGK